MIVAVAVNCPALEYAWLIEPPIGLIAADDPSPKSSVPPEMFAPVAGIAEDPATGSATAILAAQLLAAGELSDGTNRFALEQGYEMGRPSLIELTLKISGGKLIGASIGGSAVVVMDGTLEA